jgi:hypothetical protein
VWVGDDIGQRSLLIRNLAQDRRLGPDPDVAARVASNAAPIMAVESLGLTIRPCLIPTTSFTRVITVTRKKKGPTH